MINLLTLIYIYIYILSFLHS